jgi:hypothetical protein
MWKIGMILIACFFSSGCVPTANRYVSPAIPFNESEFNKFLGLGTSTIQGQVFMRTRGGAVIYGAGSKVLLVPFTQYTKQIFEGGSFNGYNDSSLAKYTRTTVADATGNFEFIDIPQGAYVALSSVEWQVPLGRTYSNEGGGVNSYVEVAVGQRIKVMLTK